jgi:hypothetical protein
MLVGQHHNGIADRYFGMTDAAGGVGQAKLLLGAERAPVEIERRGGVADDDIRNDGRGDLLPNRYLHYVSLRK